MANKNNNKNKKIGKVGIVSKNLQPHILKISKEVIDHLRGKVQVYVEKRLAKKLGRKYCAYKNRFKLEKANFDVLITVGGDGTILMTEQAISAKDIPILGINKGIVGFLNEIETDTKKYLNMLLKGKYFVEQRTKLNVKLNKKNLGDVLNDIVVTTAKPVKIQRYEVQIQNQKLGPITADGIIVSTPTGSTAYATSAGGPIIDPTVDAYEIVPICPFKLSSRPITVPSDTKTIIQVVTDRKAILALDGYTRYDITKKDKIEVTKSKHTAYFIKFQDDFYKKIKRKLV